MELSRSNPYAGHAYYSAAARQAELEAFLEQKLLQEQLAEKQQLKAEIDTHVTGRRRTQNTDEHAPRRTIVELVLKQNQQTQAPLLRSREPLPIGQASTAFIAQQVSQNQHPEISQQTTEPGEQHVFQAASQAYRDTRNLTVSLLGFQGFQERVV